MLCPNCRLDNLGLPGPECVDTATDLLVIASGSGLALPYRPDSPVVTIPRIKCRCAAKNAMIIGRVIIRSNLNLYFRINSSVF